MCYAVCFPSDDVFALTASSCHNGGEYQYCGFGRSCKACPENCYCPPRSDAKTESCTGWTGIWCDATNHKIKSNTNAGIGEGSFGIKICPDSYPFSDAGSKSIEDCYAKVGNTKIGNTSHKCNPGQYLPANSNYCASCKGGNRYYCPGGTFHTNLTKDVGLKECPSNKIANSQKSSCIDSTTYCQAGQYLPKNATKCTSCKSGRYYVCVGGTFPVYASSDQGIRKCDGNLIADSGHKQCVADTPSSTSKTTTTKITLTKNQMKFGLKGSSNTPVESQCWTKYQHKGEYISCVMKRYY